MNEHLLAFLLIVVAPSLLVGLTFSILWFCDWLSWKINRNKTSWTFFEIGTFIIPDDDQDREPPTKD